MLPAAGWKENPIDTDRTAFCVTNSPRMLKALPSKINHSKLKVSVEIFENRSQDLTLTRENLRIRARRWNGSRRTRA